jgi:hypothetical protein
MRLHSLAHRLRHAGGATSLAIAIALVAPIAAWAADVFDFIPDGGRTLLAKVLGNRAADAEVTALLAGKHSRDEWLAWMKGHASAIPGLQKLDDKQALTLADYLSFNMPQAELKPAGAPSQASWAKALPPDGRDFVLNYCQGCHIVTVVVTQNRTKEAWLGTLGKPSHVQIKLKPQQREALASYLVINGGIPIDDVPEDLRAGGATY